MRVAVIVRSLKMGGMERVSINLCEAFADRGDESHLIYFKNKKRVFTPKESVHFHHFNLEGILKKTVIGLIPYVISKILNGIIRRSQFFYNGLMFSQIFKYKLNKLEAEYGKFDLIIMRGHGTFDYIWMYKDDRVVQMVESSFIGENNYLNRLYIKCIYKDKNLAVVSKSVEDRVKNVLDYSGVKEKSLQIINNLIDIEAIKLKANEYFVDVKEQFIVSVGRINPNKNIELLIHAYAYAKKEYDISASLVIIGSGPDLEKMKAMVLGLGLDSNIKFLGQINNPYPWIKSAEVLCLTSKSEGFGMVLIEALACQTKIITTDSGGIKDIMTGELETYIVEYDIKQFAKKIAHTLNEKKEIDFKKSIYPFTNEVIVNRYEELYLK